MLDKEKLWMVIYIWFPSYTPLEKRAEVQMDVAKEWMEALDNTVRFLILPRESEDSQMTATIECVYDPRNMDGEKYEAFFEKANAYIEEFNKKYIEKSE